MSLRSGLASITGSASRAARRVLGGVLSDPEEEENDDSSDKDDGSEQDDDASDAYLPLSAVTPAVDVKADSDTTHVAVSAVKTEVVPLSEGTETPTPLGGVSAFTPSAAKSFFSTPRPTESKYDRDSVSKVSGKLVFSEKMLKRLVEVLKPTATPKKMSRSLLPKLNYAKQIMVSQQTFAAWIEQIKVYTYSRRWPAWCSSVGGSVIWDGVDDDSDDSVARREAYEWMETSIPESSKYILIFVKKGDAKGVYEALWRRFASFTVKDLQQKFWSLEMKVDEQVDHFAHLVSKAAINLSHAGIEVPDQQIATAYIQGLSKNFIMIKEKYRNLKVFSFIDVVEDATKFAIDHKIFSVRSPASSSAPQARILNGSVLTMCKYWRMKKGCFKKDACPLAKYHTPESKGKGWNEDSVNVVVPEKHVHAAVPSNTYLCHTCNKPGHFRKDCPVKNNFSKDKAKDNAKKNASAISNLSLNFMMMSPLTANLFTTYDLKAEWIMDGGATEHLCNNEKWVTNGTLKTLSTPALLTVGNGQVLQAAKSGTVHFNDVSLSDVLVCDQCPVNIISEGKLLEKGLTITKTLKDGCLVKSGKNVIMSARMQNKLMFVDKAMLSSNLSAIRRFR